MLKRSKIGFDQIQPGAPACDELAVSFGSSDLYHYDGSWTFPTAGNTEDMRCADAFYVDFVGGGLWRYDGTWTGLAGESRNPVNSMASGCRSQIP